MINICYESSQLCNLSCDYCITGDNCNYKQEIDYKAIIDVIALLKPNRLVISGGEPFLDNQLVEKLKYIRDNLKSTYISLSTNGTVDYEYEKIKEFVDCIDISLPTLDDKKYTKMRGQSLLANVKHNIEKCVKLNFNVRISWMLSKMNYLEIDDILEFTTKSKVNSLRIGRFLPFRTATSVEEKYDLNDEEIKKVEDIINGREFDFEIIHPIKNTSLMSQGYLTIDYAGNIALPDTDKKKILYVINSEKNYKEDTVVQNELKEKINYCQEQKKIFLHSFYKKYNLERLVNCERIRGKANVVLEKSDMLMSDRSRIIFSSPFRRLQQKAQVFSLEPNSNVRSRLTHSLEVADTGKRLAYKVVSKLMSISPESVDFSLASNIVSIVENACLIHDIGNPPFGHFGEKAIKNWWEQNSKEYIEKHNLWAKKSEKNEISFTKKNFSMLLEDFVEFDGNPQGLRIALRLYHVVPGEKRMDDGESGFNLTYSTILCALKYARCAGEKSLNRLSKDITKKPGYFQSEKAIITKIQESMKMENQRFPLVYLMEAADDIAYCLSDIADGFEKHILTVTEFIELFKKEWNKNYANEQMPDAFSDEAVDELLKNNIFNFNYHISTKLAIEMLNEATDAYIKNLERFLEGRIGALINKKETPSSYRILSTLEKIRVSKLYRSSEAETVELAGYSIIAGLLKFFGKLLELPYDVFKEFLDYEKDGKGKVSLDYEFRIFNRISKKFVESYKRQCKEYLSKGESDFANYEWWLRVHLIIDHISCMTDQYALKTYQTFEGIAIKVL